MTPNRHLSSFPVLFGMYDDVIADYDIIVQALTSKLHPTCTKMIERGFIGTENAKLGPKGMKLFHSFSKTAFEFQILILKLMSHQLRYTVIGQMSYQFRCIYCISSKMMTHFIINYEFRPETRVYQDF